jgi:choline dehydrogenase-like flavoprotein
VDATTAGVVTVGGCIAGGALAVRLARAGLAVTVGR